MKPLNIPVVALGPGSQPMDIEDAPNLLDLPRDISGFVMPQVPESRDGAAFESVRGVIRQLVATLSAHEAGSRPYPRLELTSLDAKSIELLNQTLLDGEVSALLTGRRGTVKIQETNFAGVWRLLHYNPAGELTRDCLEACPVPDAIPDYAADAAAPGLEPAPPPRGAMNSPPVLHEIREQAAAYVPGQPAHVVNLTLLPMSSQDSEYLNQALPAGPVAVLSRGYGKCRVSSTVLRNVWRVQYFNNMNTLILNTVEVVDIPEVVKAAREDIDDSLNRLRELLEWMEQE
ncbi:MAG TPA: hydrogenase expression/formation C-terminal domain-containing protein [Burkholderiales bacterium]|nr:hydrogenase expression/formation C-terminal domain-containing protein [Burkholderiales bacterium]